MADENEGAGAWQPAGPGQISETPPPSEVSVGAAVSQGWEALKRFFWPLIGIVLLVYAFQLPSFVADLLGGVAREALPVAPAMGLIFFLQTFSFLWSVLVLLPLGYGMAFVAYRAVTGQMPKVGDLFEGFRRYGDALGSGILVGLIVIGGLILLIIPGLIFAWKLMLVPYLVTVERLGVTEALGESWRRTRGHLGTLVLFTLASIGIMIVGFLALLVGIVPASILIAVATAALYRAITAEHRAKDATTDPSAPGEVPTGPPQT